MRCLVFRRYPGFAVPGSETIVRLYSKDLQRAVACSDCGISGNGARTARPDSPP